MSINSEMNCDNSYFEEWIPVKYVEALRSGITDYYVIAEYLDPFKAIVFKNNELFIYILNSDYGGKMDYEILDSASDIYSVEIKYIGLADVRHQWDTSKKFYAEADYFIHKKNHKLLLIATKGHRSDTIRFTKYLDEANTVKINAFSDVLKVNLAGNYEIFDNDTSRIGDIEFRINGDIISNLNYVSYNVLSMSNFYYLEDMYIELFKEHDKDFEYEHPKYFEHSIAVYDYERGWQLYTITSEFDDGKRLILENDTLKYIIQRIK